MSNKVIKRNLIIRRLILLFLDSFLLIFSVSLSFLYLQNIPVTDIGQLHFNITILGISFYLLTGQYKSIAKYTNSSFLYKLALKNFIIIFISAFIFNSTSLNKLDNKFWILLWFLITLLTCLIRIIGRDLIIYFISKNKNKSRLGIYGDCDSAYELISTLNTPLLGFG